MELPGNDRRMYFLTVQKDWSPGCTEYFNNGEIRQSEVEKYCCYEEQAFEESWSHCYRETKAEV